MLQRSPINFLSGFWCFCYLELPEAAHGEVGLHLLGRVQGDPGEVLEVFQVLGIELGQRVLHIVFR